MITRLLTTRWRVLLLVSGVACPAYAQNPVAVEAQPFAFQTKRLLETLNGLGTPLAPADQVALAAAAPAAAQALLDKYCLYTVTINPESRVSVEPGAAAPELWQGGWRTFLVKVRNQAGITARLAAFSPQAQPVFGVRGDGFNGFPKGTPAPVTPPDVTDRWLDLSLYAKAPLRPELSGLAVEYAILQLYSRDAGERAARVSFNVGAATPDLGQRDGVDALFRCQPATALTLRVLDEAGRPATASFLIQDAQGHVYPSQAKRLAPDFYFQRQVYRADGEQLLLPPGRYSVAYGRGPEYLTETTALTVAAGQPQTLTARLRRWIDPAQLGWYSGDHHIHAAGCSHYETPTQGVDPADMMRHVLGEGVNVGSVLTWGPGYYHQKQFFEGKDNRLSTPTNLLRYDLEISGFPSSHAGHLVLLRLKDQDYPGAKVIEDWPTWTLPVLRWARAQGAVTGYAHSGLGLEVASGQLPNYEVPRFDGIGANEYIVAVTQNLVDFISAADTPPAWELNIWYHTLNCGYRTRLSGETDFPCMSDDKVAHGRSYVQVAGPLTFAKWAEGLRQGRAYVSDGQSHLLDFRVNNLAVGTQGSEVRLARPGPAHVTARVAARLAEAPAAPVAPLDYGQSVWTQKPFWNLEQARLPGTRQVPVELVVNGEVVATRRITADGAVQELAFDVPLAKSSWVALRILPSSHTNPVFVLVDGQPIRASRRSAEWCLKAVDQCWSQKSPQFAAAEKATAAAAYETARAAYRKIITESPDQ